MSLIYDKTEWKDDKSTPINARNLNNIEDGIEYIYHKWDKIIQDSTTGDHASELIDARYGPNDTEHHPTLGHRLNHMDNKFQDFSSQLEQNTSYIEDIKLDVKNKLAEIDSTVTVNIANSMKEMVDTTQLYVLEDTKTWWKYGTFEISSGSLLPNINNALKWPSTKISLNKRLNSSYEEVDALGGATFYFDFKKAIGNVVTITFGPVANTYKYIALSIKLKDGIALTESDLADYVITLDGNETNLLDTGELYLNQRYSQSSAGLSSENGLFALIIPFEANTNKSHTLKMVGIPNDYIIDKATSTLYLLDSNKSNAIIVNGSNFIASMTKGVTNTNEIIDKELYAIQQKLLNVDPCWIRMKGCSLYPTSNNSNFTKVVVWDSSGKATAYTPEANVLMYEETEDGISSTPYPSSTFEYTNNKTAPITATKFGYGNTTNYANSTNTKLSAYMNAADGKLAFSVIVNFASETPITEKDLEDVYITFDEPILSYGTRYENEWYDTGIAYIPGEPVTAVELSNRIDELEVKVETVKNLINSSSTSSLNLPNYWIDRLKDISPKIEELQKEYGIDAFQFLWGSDIHGVPSSSPNNTTYIGAICRYMMDKHNIPFLTLSGDIMSQASYTSVEPIWEEYEKLNNMLSVIRNDEFLAVRGNHDGAWGDASLGEQWLKFIGTKELFNAFYRRQTLDRNRIFGKDGTYFYVDCPNVRFYMLNAHTDGDGSKNSNDVPTYHCYKHYVFGNEQLNWIADSLLTVQEGQKVIFMAHPPTKYCVDGTVFEGMISAYKNRTNYTGTMNITGTYWGTDEKYSKVSVNKDFTNAKGDLVGYFHGHIHQDTITADSEYPIIGITSAGGDLRDTYLTNGTLTRTKGTPTETAMDLVTITSDYIYFTRIGCGYDRKYNRLTKEVAIDYDSAYIN